MPEQTEPRIGDVQTDERGTWVIVAVTSLGLSRLQVGSVAHRIFAQTDPRIAASLKPEEAA